MTVRFQCPVSRCPWYRNEPEPGPPDAPWALVLERALTPGSVLREHLKAHPAEERTWALLRLSQEADRDAWDQVIR